MKTIPKRNNFCGWDVENVMKSGSPLGYFKWHPREYKW